MYNTFLGSGRVKIGGVTRYYFKFLNGSSHLSVHLKILLFLNKSKKGAWLLVDLDKT